MVTQRSSSGRTSDVRIFHVTNIGSTTFSIYCNNASGTQVAGEYYWMAAL